MRPRGVTLIEMLIVVAIMAILAASLAFSATQIATRSEMTRRAMEIETSLAVALDAIAGDVAQSTNHAVDSTGALRLDLASDGVGAQRAVPAADGGRQRAIHYTLGGDRLLRRVIDGDLIAERVLAADLATCEFTADANGLHIALHAGFQMGWRAPERSLEAFVAWPLREQRVQP